jgi:hypothetical protein
MSTPSTIINALVRDMPGLLRGWPEIAAYCRKAPATLRRYARREGFPAARWGRHVYADRHPIAVWLLERERRLRPRQG